MQRKKEMKPVAQTRNRDVIISELDCADCQEICETYLRGLRNDMESIYEKQMVDQTNKTKKEIEDKVNHFFEGFIKDEYGDIDGTINIKQFPKDFQQDVQQYNSIKKIYKIFGDATHSPDARLDKAFLKLNTQINYLSSRNKEGLIVGFLKDLYAKFMSIFSRFADADTLKPKGDEVIEQLRNVERRRTRGG